MQSFYNRVNGKFEPIGFDGHYGLNNINIHYPRFFGLW